MTKKTLSLILAAMLAVSAFTACTSEPEDSGKSTQTTATEAAESENGTQTDTEAVGSETEAVNPEIGNGYVDVWYIYGDLGLESLTVEEDGYWALRNSVDEEGNGGFIFAEGTGEMQEDGSIALTEVTLGEIGSAMLEDDKITLDLDTQFGWLLQSYLPGILTFEREGASIRGAYDEGNNGYTTSDYMGYWQYDNGLVLDINTEGWILYNGDGTVVQSGPIEYDNSSAYLMNEDGSSGGGMLNFNENGELNDMGNLLTKLESLPF